MAFFEKNIFDQLKKEHGELEYLLKRAETATGSARRMLVDEIEEHFTPHARSEEKTLYAVLREQAVQLKMVETNEMANQAYEEHRMVDDLLIDLKRTETTNESWLSKLKVLKKNIEDHIREEEEQLFSKAKNILSFEEQFRLAEAYKQAKEEFERTMPKQSQISERSPTKAARQAV